MASQSLISRLKDVSFSRQILSVLAIAAIILSAILVFRGQPDRSEKPPTNTPPRASAAFAGAPSVAGSGIIEPSSEIIEIGTSLPGIITKVYVVEGDQVAPGQPLFAVDDRSSRARIDEANAAISGARAARETARASLATAQQQRALYEGVEDSRAISRQEVIGSSGTVRTARAQLAQAEADIRSAEAMRASASTDLDRLIVRAPIAAQVLNVNVRPGEFVNTGGPQSGSNPYVEIGTTNPLYVRVDIDENEIGRTRIGSAAVISPRGNSAKRVKAAFVRAEPLVTPKVSLTNSSSERVDVRVLQLLFEVPQNSGFFVGQQVDAFIRANSQNAGNAAAKKSDGK